MCVLCGAFAACGTDKVAPPQLEEHVASVTVSPTLVTLAPGTSEQLTAVAMTASGTPLPGRTFTWSTVDTTVAKVSTAGFVTGVAKGSTIVTATSEGQSGMAGVNVKVSSLPVSGVYVQFERRGWASEYLSGQVI